MIDFFKKQFKEITNRKGRLLKLKGVLLLFLAIVFAEFLFLADHQGRVSLENILATIAPDELVELTNVRREEREIEPLSTDPDLVEAAQMKADHMAENEYFAHTSPDGTEPWHWFDEAGYHYRKAGENLAIDFVETQRVAQAWMDSPTHKENIISEEFDDIGIATAKGSYEGRETTFVVQLFGTKLEKTPTPEKEEDEDIEEEPREDYALREDERGDEDERVEPAGDDQPQKEDEDVEEDEDIKEGGESETEEKPKEKETKKEENEKEMEEELEKEEEHIPKEEDKRDEEEDKEEEESEIEEKPKSSFAFLEKEDSDKKTVSVGEPEEILLALTEEEDYTTLLGKLANSPFETLGYVFLFSVGVLLYISLLNLFFKKKISIINVAFYQLIILVTGSAALFTSHLLLSVVQLI